MLPQPPPVLRTWKTWREHIHLCESEAQLSKLRYASYLQPALILTGTRDRATYDPSLTTAVSYTVASATDAPTSLTYGPSFISLAASYGGEIILGLNRRLNNISNTIAAAELAQSQATKLYAIELGNEPNCKIQILLSLWYLGIKC